MHLASGFFQTATDTEWLPSSQSESIRTVMAFQLFGVFILEEDCSLGRAWCLLVWDLATTKKCWFTFNQTWTQNHLQYLFLMDLGMYHYPYCFCSWSSCLKIYILNKIVKQHICFRAQFINKILINQLKWFTWSRDISANLVEMYSDVALLCKLCSGSEIQIFRRLENFSLGDLLNISSHALCAAAFTIQSSHWPVLKQLVLWKSPLSLFAQLLSYHQSVPTLLFEIHNR